MCAATFGDLAELYFFAENAPFNTAFSPKANSFNLDLQKNSRAWRKHDQQTRGKSKDPDLGWVKSKNQDPDPG
jgi:hypothetical protein